MGAGSHSESLTLGGRSLTRTISTTADNDSMAGGTASPIALVLPSAVSSWVKTDADTAAGNVAAGSPVATGKVDVYWDGGLRYGVDCVRSTNALALDGGTGTDFPANADTTVVVANQQQINVSIDGDLAALVGILATCPAHMDCQDASSHSIRALTLYANQPDLWDSNMAVNPYTGDPITKAMTSNGTLAWVTSTAYAVGAVVWNSTTTYKCLVAHTSGTFATDLAAADWVAVSPTLEILVSQDSTP
jgi:hypothetical protein